MQGGSRGTSHKSSNKVSTRSLNHTVAVDTQMGYRVNSMLAHTLGYIQPTAAPKRWQAQSNTDTTSAN